jgi:molybdopterin-binding protein
MASYKPGEVAALLGVSVDTVRRSEDGHREVEGEDLARYLAEQEEPGTTRPIVGESARNRFTGIVTKVVANDVVATVELRAGRHRIVSLMTAEAVADLGLRPGVLAVAAVKSTHVVVEVPAR